MALTNFLGELAFLVMPSLDQCPAAAPAWAKRARVSLKMLRRSKRKPVQPAPQVWAPAQPHLHQTGAQVKALALQSAAGANAQFARYQNALYHVGDSTSAGVS